MCEVTKFFESFQQVRPPYIFRKLKRVGEVKWDFPYMQYPFFSLGVLVLLLSLQSLSQFDKIVAYCSKFVNPAECEKGGIL